MTLAHVVIPTKSNIAGVEAISRSLERRHGIDKLVIVADGDNAYKRLTASYTLGHFLDSHVILTKVPLGAGIHVMWNHGTALATSGQAEGCKHVLYLNDDVTVNASTVYALASTLDRCPELGIVSPNYADATRFEYGSQYKQVHDLCYSRYDGNGGLAGFAMMLAADLVAEWRFDERMKWWYGDDDVLNWVTKTKGRKAAIVRDAVCSANESWTIRHDPPPNFAELIEEDHRIYKSKWR